MDKKQEREVKREIKNLQKNLKDAKDFLKLLVVCEKAGDEVALQCGVMITEEELARNICEVDWDNIPVITKAKNLSLNARIVKGENEKYICVDNKQCFSCEEEFKNSDSIKTKDCVSFHVECLRKMEDENK